MHLKDLFRDISPTISNAQPATTIMSDMYWEEEEQINKAWNALRNEEYSSVHVAFLAFGIIPRMLRLPTGRTLMEKPESTLYK